MFAWRLFCINLFSKICCRHRRTEEPISQRTLDKCPGFRDSFRLFQRMMAGIIFMGIGREGNMDLCLSKWYLALSPISLQGFCCRIKNALSCFVDREMMPEQDTDTALRAFPKHWYNGLVQCSRHGITL